jgi:phosphoglycolate phosphatase
MYSAVIFDLDGTLLDTLEDLTDGVNAALTAHGFPERTIDEVRAFVGNGVERLMERAVPGGWENPAFAACFADFKTAYAAGCTNKTRPYDGMLDLLDRLRAQKIPTAIVSNKFDPAVKKLAAFYFGDRVSVAVGERPGVRKKPAPDTVFEALRNLELPAAGAVFVGDSDVDIATAKAAGLPCISVTWGFRDRQFLLKNGATSFADTAAQLYERIVNGIPH